MKSKFTLTQILMYKFKLEDTGLLVGLYHEEKIIFSQICDEALKLEDKIRTTHYKSYILPWLRRLYTEHQSFRFKRKIFPVDAAVRYLHKQMAHKNILNIFEHVDQEAEFYNLCANDFIGLCKYEMSKL
jgi:hypothetical protein